MPTPITQVASGGLAVTEVDRDNVTNAPTVTPVTPVASGGIAVTVVSSGGLPVTFVNNDLSDADPS
jgi:hypothetical protein